ncbi:Major facilitator superfamily domain, general substrate transporter [Pseudocohnilembus persalinus]|uniref:Lysosomal dipeptide transporter MFSD1 n=1 Tax=Pseudocohnilembus persalinus TaxID=266149 RepID=A0A0V0QCN5_PSEPJ|nr:Major facilitator superfamily domain, general substrate transporter [Pseudocohnilembus persalinus]|eukprot:KRW99997.1 Major facilitator superfamily domain, general substrate transporter [Pseudocohnilembus persalinus]
MDGEPITFYISRVGMLMFNQTSLIMANSHMGTIFEQNELGLSTAVIQCLGIIGTGVNMYFAPVFYEKYGLMGNFILSLFLLVLGLFFLAYNLIQSIKKEKENEQMFLMEMGIIKRQESYQNNNQYHEDEELQSEESAYKIIPNRRYYNSGIQQSMVSSKYSTKQEYKEIYNSFINLGANYWILAFSIVSFQVIYSIIDMQGNSFVEYKWNFTPKQASQVESVFPFVSLLLPIIGKMIDKFSNQSDYITTFSLFITTISLIFIIEIDPLYGFLLFGVGNTVKSAVYIPILSLTLGTQNMGVPLSIIKSLTDLFSFIAIFISTLTVNSKVFIMETAVIIGILGTLAGIWLTIKLRKKSFKLGLDLK